MALRYNSIQKGTITLGAGDTSGTLTITSVNTARSVVLASYRAADVVNAEQTQVSTQLTNATTVTATRGNSGVVAVVEVTVIEFGSGILDVQRGAITLAAASASNTATISSVATGRAWVIASDRWTGGTTQVGSNTIARVELTNATTITATRGASAGECVVEYQVVEFETDADGTVQRGTQAVSGVDTQDVTLGTAVTLARAFPWGTTSTGSAAPGPNQTCCSLTLTSTTSLRLQRNATNATPTIAWQVVELASDWAVQAVTVAMLNGETSNADTISAVDTDASVLVVPNRGNWLRVANSGNQLSRGMVSAVFASTTSVTTQRTPDLGNLDGAVYAISGVQGVAGPTITDQPANATVLLSEGTSASFTVAATGTGTLSYQWNRNAAPISGATSATLNVTGIVIGDDGDTFDCDVTDDNGTTASNAATLTVLVGDVLSAAGGTTDSSGEAVTQYTTDASAAAGVVSRVRAVSGGVAKTLAMRPGG